MSKKEYVLDSLFQDIPTEDYNENWSEHREKARNMLKKGLYGFIGGTLIFGFLQLLMHSISSNTGSLTFSEIWPQILMSLSIGIACIGLPFGWELLNRLTGQWSIWGNYVIVIALFAFKLAFAALIGMYVYPFVLIYHIIKSKKSKRKVKLWTTISISAVVLWFLFLVICIIIVASWNPGANNADSTKTTAAQTVNVSTFDNHTELLTAVSQKAVESTVETEKQRIDNYGWAITSPTQIHGIFFLEAQNPDDPHRNILNKLDVSNAIIVVTGYFLEDAGIPINQWEMEAWVYPNYSFDEDGILSYDTENVYKHSLRSTDMDDFMEWFNSEFVFVVKRIGDIICND